jgi:hypothetical protein
MARRREGSREYYAEDAADAARARAIAGHPCGVCGDRNAPFGYRPPAIPAGEQWRCREHRFEVEGVGWDLTLPPEVFARVNRLESP